MIPLLVIRTYRLIPPRVRGAVFRGNSTSHLALAAIAAGMSGWKALWVFGRPRLRTPGGSWGNDLSTGDGGFFR
jgi:hypothetical protein